MARIRLQGKRLDTSAASGRAKFAAGLELRDRVAASKSSRDAGHGVELTADDDDVLELRCEGGVIELLSVAEARELAHRNRGSRGDDFELQTSFHAGAARGDIKLVVDEVRHFSVKPLHDRIKGSFIRQGAELTAEAVAAVLEAEFWNSRPVGLGLRQVNHEQETLELLPSDVSNLSAGAAPYLLLLHGTFSNATAAFHGLSHTQEWRDLREQYAGRILAFEHKTLAQSPLDNALALASVLPEGSELHLITHSRGGLVGDLLNLPVIEQKAIDELATLRAGKRPQQRLSDLMRRSFDEHVEKEGEALRALSDMLTRRKLRVARYLRVAAPAGGTVLASRRLDRVLKLVLKVVGLTPGLLGNPAFEFVQALAIATLGLKTDPRLLPGIESMMPDSPFIRLLNQHRVRADDRLAVVAGDIEGAGLFGRLKVLATDLLYGFVDHDLVVNTDSMYQGLRRHRAFASFQQGPQIAHTAYFADKVTRARVHNYFFAPPVRPSDEVRGFRVIGPGVIKTPADNETRDGRKPSTSAILVRAQFAAANPDLAHGELVNGLSDLLAHATDLYEPLTAELCKSARVVSLDYDLQKSPAQLGQQVRASVAAEQKAGAARVSIVAHSGAALGVVAMLHDEPDLLGKLGGTVVLLGPPLYGSFEVLRWLLGSGALVQQLELLDIHRTAAQLGSTLCQQPGIRALLPPSDALKQLGIPAYAQVADAISSLRAPIDHALREMRLRGVHCVFGCASAPVITPGPPQPAAVEAEALSAMGHATPAEYEPWPGSHAGDGFITPCTPDRVGGANAWLARTDHAGLVSDPFVCGAIRDLVDRATTSGLSMAPSAPLQAEPQTIASFPCLFPTGERIVRAAMGVIAAAIADDNNVHALDIAVVNGALDSCKGPVAIGHYTGAPIVGAGAYLDKHLEGALRDHQYLGLYPETSGHSQLIGRGAGRQIYAVVLGLGPNGELTPERLTATMADAALRCAMTEAQDQQHEQDQEVLLQLNTLLIGTVGRQALSIPTSVAALVRGVLRANRALLQQGAERANGDNREGFQLIRIAKLTFIERYQDLAEEAAEAVRNLDTLLSAELHDGTRLQPQQYVTEREKGWRPGRPRQDYEQGAWQPLIIEVAPGHAAAARKSDAGPECEQRLSFTYLGRLARIDDSDGTAATTQIQNLIEQTVSRHDIAQINNTIYELLIPQQLKDDVASASNLQLVLDDKTATLPWELMATRDHRGALQPLSTRVGVLRRLRLDRSRSRRERDRAPMAMDALVVGDPYAGTSYPKLDGARDEALAVERLLSNAGYSVRSVIGRDDDSAWREILDAVFERGYRIMHIAAHGRYFASEPSRSGVVIGPGQFLTASTIRQLPVVPELVFLNCCHLGRMNDGLPQDASKPEATLGEHLNQLAANVAIGLMEIGVRAVIAAGWAVADVAASAFAKRFYEDMLNGHAFGDAVTRARQAAYDADRSSNTWGAYQCYGEPAFRLSHGKTSDEVAHRVVGRAGFNRALENLTEDAAEARQEGELSPLRGRLQWLEREAPPQWLRSADTRYWLGRAYSELGEYEAAIGHYKAGFESNSAKWPAELVEQLANMQVRLAAERVHSAKAKCTDPEIERLFAAAHKLLQAMTVLRETPERLAVLGSYHKKRATTLLEQAEIRDELAKAADYYGRAWRASPSDSTYQANNYLQMLALLARPLSPEELDLLSTCVQRAEEEASKAESFWNIVALPDALLARLLQQHTSGAQTEQQTQQTLALIAERYSHAFKIYMRSTVRERNSTTEHLRDLEILCERLGLKSLQRSLMRIIEKLQLQAYRRQVADPIELPRGSIDESADRAANLCREANPEGPRPRGPRTTRSGDYVEDETMASETETKQGALSSSEPRGR